MLFVVVKYGKIIGFASEPSDGDKMIIDYYELVRNQTTYLDVY